MDEADSSYSGEQIHYSTDSYLESIETPIATHLSPIEKWELSSSFDSMASMNTVVPETPFEGSDGSETQPPDDSETQPPNDSKVEYTESEKTFMRLQAIYFPTLYGSLPFINSVVPETQFEGSEGSGSETPPPIDSKLEYTESEKKNATDHMAWSLNSPLICEYITDFKPSPV